MPDLTPELRQKYAGVQSFEDVTDESVTVVDPAGQRQTVPRSALPPELDQAAESYRQPQGQTVPFSPQGQPMDLTGGQGAGAQPQTLADVEDAGAQGGPTIDFTGDTPTVEPDATGGPQAVVDEREQAPQQGQGDFVFSGGGLPPNPYAGGDPNQVIASRGGGMSTVARQQQRQSGVDVSEEQEQLQQAGEEQQESVRRQAEAKAMGRLEAAETLEDIEATNARFAERQQEIQAEAAKEQERIMGDLSQVQERISNFEVDPDRIWAEKGTGAKIGAAIGVALGAIGSAMTGGPNTAMQIIQKAIDRDIQAQREKRAALGQEAKTVQGALAAARSITQDEREALNAARVMELQGAKAKLDSIAARTESDVVRERAQQLAGQIDAEMATNVAQLKQQTAERVVTTESQKRTPRQVITRGDAAAAHDEQQGVAQFDRERYVPAAGGNAPTKKEAQEIRKLSADFSKMKRMLRNLREFTEKANSDRINPAERARATQEAKRLQLLLKGESFGQLGVLSGPDLDLINSISPDDPESIFSVNASRYGNLARILEQEEHDVYRDMGVQQVRKGTVPRSLRGRVRANPGSLTGQGGRRAEQNFQELD